MRHARLRIARAQQHGAVLFADVRRADPPALARRRMRRGAHAHVAVDLREALAGRQCEQARGVDVRRTGLDLACLGGGVQVDVLAHEAAVVRAAACEPRRDADDVPVGGDLRGIGRVQAQRAAAHLADRDARRRDRHVDEAVHARCVPALTEQRAGADQRLRGTGGEDRAREPDPGARDPPRAVRRDHREAVGVQRPVPALQPQPLGPWPARAARRSARRRRAARSARRGRSRAAGAAARSGRRRPAPAAPRSRCRPRGGAPRAERRRAAARQARRRPGRRARSAAPRASISQPTSSTSASGLAAEAVSTRSTSPAPRRTPWRVSVKPKSRRAAAIVS